MRYGICCSGFLQVMFRFYSNIGLIIVHIYVTEIPEIQLQEYL